MVNLLSEDEFLSRALNVPLQSINWHLAQQKDVDILVRRDDLIDESLSGNKFYKLFYNLQAAKGAGHKKILSFGGAYSNHIYALAAAGRDFGFETVGVIRGERPKHLSPTLQDAERWGMQLEFISRENYREKMASELHQVAPELHSYLANIYGDFYSIPEGGANAEGILGTKAIGWAIREQIGDNFSSVCVASGTGNTLAGIASGLYSDVNTSGKDSKIAIGFSVLKGDGNLGRDIYRQSQNINTCINNWRLISGYHAGGYAKKLPQAVQNFKESFERETTLLLDPVYTVKMCWGVAQLLAQDYWPRGSRLVLVHTGGLQGKRGFAV